MDDIDLFGDEYGDESTPIPNDALTRALTDLHKGAYEKAGFQFLLEQAFLYTKGHHAAPNEETSGSSQSWYKLHAQAGLQLFKSGRHQGTWIKSELSGSVALNRHTHRTTLDDSWGASGRPIATFLKTVISTCRNCSFPRVSWTAGSSSWAA